MVPAPRVEHHLDQYQQHHCCQRHTVSSPIRGTLWLRQNEKGPLNGGLFGFGAGTKSRTRDLLITNQLLYQLSYAGLFGLSLSRGAHYSLFVPA
jgi:hypothetical protein